MKRSDVFKSRFLNADNVPSPIVVTIAFAKKEPLENMKGQSEDKCVLYFSDHKQNLALNGINFDSVEDISGEDDTDRWPGTRIEIYRTMTEVSGKPTPCIRVRAPSTEMALGKPVAKSTPETETTKPAKADMNDEIPF